MTYESWLEPKTPEQVTEILAKLRHRLERTYGDRLRGLYLYGSYARGEAEPESDIDVLVLLDDLGGYVAEVRMAGGVIAELSLEHTVSITPVFVAERDWREAATPFLANAREDAVAA